MSTLLGPVWHPQPSHVVWEKQCRIRGETIALAFKIWWRQVCLRSQPADYRLPFHSHQSVLESLWISSVNYSYTECWRRQWYPTPVFLPGKSHGWRSLVGCSPWGREESDTTKRLHFHFSLSCTEEGNGNPVQYSCLENPRDGGAWWAGVSGVAQSRTWLKWLRVQPVAKVVSERGP